MSTKRISISVFLILINLVCVSFAQESPVFESFNTKDGLSNGRVTNILQDTLGFVWIGTKNGLNRYDGSTTRVYNTANSTLSSNDISSLFIDDQNTLWVGTVGGGVNSYDSFRDTFIYYKNISKKSSPLNSNAIYTIFQDGDKDIWIGTEDGLSRKNTKESKSEFISVGEPQLNSKSVGVLSIYEYKKGMFLIGTNGGGLFKYNKLDNKFSHLNNGRNSSIDFINVIFPLKDNELLIGSNGKGLLKFNTQTEGITQFLNDSLHNRASIIRTISRDDSDNIWVGTDGQGILKITTATDGKFLVKNYKNNSQLKTSLANNTVNTIFQDDQANMWIGTAWKGINILKRKAENSVFFYSDIIGHNPSPILSVYKEKNKLWMGTDGKGLTISNIVDSNTNFYSKDENSSIGGEFIQHIKKGNEGNYWIGTFSNGLIEFNPKEGKLRQFKRDSNDKISLPYNDVRDVLESDSGNLWVATWGGGLSYFDSKKQEFLNYQFKSGCTNCISSNNVLSLVKDNEFIWIATFGGGLNKFNTRTEQFLNYKEDAKDTTKQVSNYIFTIFKGKNDLLWLGTKRGLFQFDTKAETFNKITVGNSDNSNVIVGLLQDDENNIWLSTKDGIFKYNTVEKRIESFRDLRGEFHINSVYKDITGLLYFGGVDGLIVINPNGIKSDQKFPKIVFTDFKLANKSVDAGNSEVLKKHIIYQDDITLSHSQSVFTFEFASLQYPSSKDIHYAIKMEGFDKEWRNIGAKQSTTYTNLPAGNYTFKIRNQSLNGEWNQEATSVNIKILPPFWKTWQAYLLYFLILLIILFFIRQYTLKWAEIKNKLKIERYQKEQEVKLNNIKQQFFSNISHEIRTPLSLILGSLNSLLKENFESKERKSLSIIKSNTNRLLSLVNELLNFRKLETGNIELRVNRSNIVTFIHEMFLAFSQQALMNKIDYKFTVSQENIYAWFDKKQFEKVIFNLLSNAFKFTKKEGKIELIIEQNKNQITVEIKDNGKGISEEKLPFIFDRFYQSENIKSNGFGIGLSIVKDIMDLHSGSISAESKLNEGSTFKITLPLGKEHFSVDQISPNISEEEDVNNYIEGIPQKNKEEKFSGELILIIEDNLHLREYIKGVLTKIYRVKTASNGEKGLKKAIRHIPDLIISDVMMPKLDGFSFCHKLKSDIRISHIPVILLTARTLTLDQIEGYSKGADDYITKPFNESLLKVRIKNLLLTRKKLSERFKKESLLSPKEITLDSPDSIFLNKFIKIIEDNSEISEFNIDQLSRDMAMSHSNIYKKVKALTGMTIIGFVKDFRLKRAAQLLKQNKISITDVCFKVGYTDRKHFSREFKKKFGVSPSIYIKENSPLQP